jgi:hypothetical protein
MAEGHYADRLRAAFGNTHLTSEGSSRFCHTTDEDWELRETWLTQRGNGQTRTGASEQRYTARVCGRERQVNKCPIRCSTEDNTIRSEG